MFSKFLHRVSSTLVLAATVLLASAPQVLAAGQNELATSRLTFFATVTGDEEGRQPNLAAWKTTAFFGLPLNGLRGQ